jgi:hypothetical protein
VASLESKRKRSAAVDVEAHAEALEVVHACRGLGAQHRDGRAANQAPPGALGIGAVRLRTVVAGQCGGEPPWAQ